MSKNTWPFPDRPGVPLDPEKDGWHWVENKYSGDRRAILWLHDLHWGIRSTISEVEKACTYLGPCLTPAEIAAQAARITELNSALENVLWVYRATQSGGGNAETTNKIEEKIAKAYAILQKGKKDE